eukprot:XP_002261457.1 hypothetical protein, conserved in Plasmodium species [Plasmodium knowlesi strain H]
MIYVDSFDQKNDGNDLNNLSCSWRYYCQEEFHFCEYGCSSKKNFKEGYNVLNTTNFRENCFINVECENHQIYFDTEDPVHFLFFAKPFFRINRDFTLYVHLAQRNKASDESAHPTNEPTGNPIWTTLRLSWEKINDWRKSISKKHKRTFIKLLICLILIHMILFYLYIYTYLYLDKHDEV